MNSNDEEDRSPPTNRRNWTAVKASLRVLYGFILLIDGAMKFTNMAPSDVVNLVQAAGQGQPDWLAGWFTFWLNVVSANPTFVLYAVGILELLLGVALILGFARKLTYFSGIVLTLAIWSIDEGFGGPYGPGSTDIGAAIIYVLVFLALIAIDATSPSKYCLDTAIERRWKWWSKLADVA